MELELIRTYYSEGTNGSLYTEGVFICHCIELPWHNNVPQLSCIPEGKYLLQKRYSKRFGWHLWITGVKNRSMILIHPANDAAKELRGCIAPVLRFTGDGKGLFSRLAMQLLLKLVDDQPEDEKIWLVIKKEA